MELARRDGREAITMRAVAKELGTRPMSLYSHVRDKDDLLAGVATRALDRLALEPQREGTWGERLGSWMHSLRRELLAAPELMQLFSELRYGSPQLLRTTRLAAEILVGAGYERAAAAEAAQGLLWGAFGFFLLESPQRQRSSGEPPEVQLAAALASMSDREREQTQPFLPHFATRDFDSLYDTLVRNLIAGLESRLGL
jgi:AcrR family transcriptional regulator